MSELKPCPFCGKSMILKTKQDHHGKFFYLGCTSDPLGKDTCPGRWLYYIEPIDNLYNAISLLNTRPIEDDLRKRLEDALGEVEHLKDTRQDPYDQIEVLQAENNKFRAEIDRLHEASEKLDIARLRAEIEAHEEMCADCVKLTDALMALVKYGERVRRWITLGHPEPYWYEDFSSDIERAEKVLEEQKS